MALNVCTFSGNFLPCLMLIIYSLDFSIQLEHNCKLTRFNSLHGLQAGVCLTTVTCQTRQRSKSLPDLLMYFSTDDVSTK